MSFCLQGLFVYLIQSMREVLSGVFVLWVWRCVCGGVSVDPCVLVTQTVVCGFLISNKGETRVGVFGVVYLPYITNS